MNNNFDVDKIKKKHFKGMNKMSKGKKIVGIIIGIIVAIVIFVVGTIIISVNIVTSKKSLHGLLSTNSVSEAMDYLGNDYISKENPEENKNYVPKDDNSYNDDYWFIVSDKDYFYKNAAFDKIKDTEVELTIGKSSFGDGRTYKELMIYFTMDSDNQDALNEIYSSFHNSKKDNWTCETGEESEYIYERYYEDKIPVQTMNTYSSLTDNENKSRVIITKKYKE